MPKKNPFSLSFGKKPQSLVSRVLQTNEIIDEFTADTPSNYIYILTGVRGSGKTVMMTTIAHSIAADENWVILELNPMRDLLGELAAGLYDQKNVQHLFLSAKLNLSAFGIGLSLEGIPPIADIENAISRMLTELKKAGKRVLITIDEITNTENMRIFVSAYQIFLRQDLPLFLLMTGLYENIYELQNDKSLTFMYRAPKVFLAPLNYTSVRSFYQKTFDISQEAAAEMADTVCGYPFAFQLLGYLYWNKAAATELNDLLDEFDHYLSEYVYEKIWSEMSATDRQVAAMIATEKEISVKDLRERLNGMSPEKFSVYRERLKRKGIVDTGTYGRISFSLPRFDVFVKNMTE